MLKYNNATTTKERPISSKFTIYINEIGVNLPNDTFKQPYKHFLKFANRISRNPCFLFCIKLM